MSVFKTRWHVAIGFFGLTLLSGARAGDLNAFDRVFSSAGEPPFIHYRARYEDGRGTHQLTVWRSGQTHCRRNTDGVTDSYIEHGKEGEDWSMVMDHHATRTRTRLNRQTLMDMGSVVDWFDLTHGLNRPWGAHEVTTLTLSPALTRPPIHPCDWYLLKQEGTVTEICWSSELALPLMIKTPGSRDPLWVIEAVDTDPISNEVFEIPDAHYAERDVMQDKDED